MRVLFVFGLPATPLASNHSGAASRSLQEFRVLQELGHEVHVVRLGRRNTLDPVLAFESRSCEAREARDQAASWEEVTVDPAGARTKLTLLRQSLTDPPSFEFPSARQASAMLVAEVERVRPDLLWVEATEAAAIVHAMRPRVPWVFSQQDWLYRVRRFRNASSSIKARWFQDVCRRAEKAVYRSASAALSCSLTDAQRLSEACRRDVVQIPYSYNPRPSIGGAEVASPELRITHLGGVETTSNRVGLEAYFARVHRPTTEACRRRGVAMELRLLGDMSTAKEPLKSMIRGSGALLTGHVTDFASALRPFDVSIIPYEHDTGFRSKMPLLMSYGQVLVATRASLAGSWVEGLDRVCRICDRLDDFPAVLADLAAQPTERERLGRAAREFFDRNFTHDRVKPRYAQLLRMFQGA
jgi:glycosyltransferase involved in cell wall biosynthesis